MAKMFYTMEEAAQKLGVSEAEIKEMAVSGKLQQFRDRDKLMFKREQVDAMASSEGSTLGGGEIGSDTDQLMPLVDSGDTDAIDLASSGSATGIEDPRGATGISVFDAGEIGEADPLAQTQMTSSGSVTDDAELSLESVGSGSGLLDLTHESDDTSLGAELLDEIYPGGGEGSDAKMDSGLGASNVFESAAGLEVGAMPEGVPTGEVVATGTVVYSSEPSDPAGNGLSIGMLVGATAAMVIALVVAISLVQGVPTALVNTITGDQPATATNGVYMWAGGIFGASVVLGIVGMFIGKAADR